MENHDRKNSYTVIKKFLDVFKRKNEIIISDEEVNSIKNADFFLGNTGLVNNGNQCYMNAVMQALVLTKKFSQHTIMNKSTSPLWWSMAQLFVKMKYSPFGVVNPQDFYDIVTPVAFGDEQQDSAEFLMVLLNRLRAVEENSVDENIDEVKYIPEAPVKRGNFKQLYDKDIERLLLKNGKSRSKLFRRRPRLPTLFEETSVNAMFRGQYSTYVQCGKCGNTTTSTEPFYELQLGVPEPNSKKTLQELIYDFVEPSEIDTDNMYYCVKCQKRVVGSIRTAFDVCPEYLIIATKNFKSSSEISVDEKSSSNVYNNEEVIIPVEAEKKNFRYKHYAAIIHFGVTSASGHFYTIGKNKTGWYIYDDEAVTLINKHGGSNLLGVNNLLRFNHPHVLFYQRVDISTPEPTFESIPRHLKEVVYRELEVSIQILLDGRKKICCWIGVSMLFVLITIEHAVK